MTNEEKIIKIIEKSLKAILAIAIFKEKKEKKPNSINDLINLEKNFYINGSGFFVNKKGIIATNRHILLENQKEYIGFDFQGKKLNLELIDIDKTNDLALLKVKDFKNNFPTLKLGDANKLKLGQTIIAIGHAFGIFKNSVSVGVISGLNRQVLTKQKKEENNFLEMEDLIQTDAAINPGNSGGPLLNLKGEVVGINIAILKQAQNISFAIPINYLIKDLKDFEKFGKFKKPYLGIKYLTINETIKNYLNLPVNYGILITKKHPFDEAVIKDSPAFKIGLKENDIILTWQNKKITPENSLSELVNQSQVGEKIKLKILRKNKIIEKVLILEEKTIYF